MNEPKTIPPSENKQAGVNKQSAPWNPYQISGIMFFATTIVAGIVLGINWKRLGKPEWQFKTILLSIIIPGLAITFVLVWIFTFFKNPTLPIQVKLIVPYLAMGMNFGYIWALARLQDGAYKVYKIQGLEALSNYEYNLRGAMIFWISIMLIFGIGGTFLFPLLQK